MQKNSTNDMNSLIMDFFFFKANQELNKAFEKHVLVF